MKNKRIGFVIQGRTFSKSILPLAIMSDQIEGITPVLMFFENRPGKPHDDIDINHVAQTYGLLGHKVEKAPETYFVKNQGQVYQCVLDRQIDCIVGQDIQYHLKDVLEKIKPKGVKTFSICNFFDSLHHAYDVADQKKNILEPDGMFFPDARFEKAHEKLLGNPETHYEKFSLGNPFYDHVIFNEMIQYKGLFPDPKKKSVVFFTTLQNLVTTEVQKSLETFLLNCLDNDVTVMIKSKIKTPWVFMDQRLNEINQINGELGLPGCSLSLMLNTDAQISSYSTSAVEAEYFGKPVINISSVKKEKLTDSVRRIKYEYGIDSPYNSETAITASTGYLDIFKSLLQQHPNPKEQITWENNNSIRILKAIKNFL